MGIDTLGYVPPEAMEDRRPWKELTDEEKQERAKAAKQNIDKMVEEKKKSQEAVEKSSGGSEVKEPVKAEDFDIWSKGHTNEASFLRKKDARERGEKS